MITGTNPTRRSFLSGLVYLVSFGFMQLVWTLDKPGITRNTNAVAWKLANFFVDKKSAKIVGLEYLRSAPSEANAGLLIDLICSSDGERHAEFAQADNYMLRELLQHQLRQDFEYDRVVNVRGWLLSETEARLCALVALTA
jgi:hypothetical protein